MTDSFVKPYGGDPFVGHLSTPVSDSGFTRALIQNLPAYRKGLSPLLRGLEVGMAHGYFLVGPWVKLGPLRNTEHAALGGLVGAVGLVMIATIALSAYGLAYFQSDETGHSYNLESGQGWSKFSGGFFIGATGGAFFAYLLLANLPTLMGLIEGGM
jgi:photosystem I subunit XI